MAGEDPELAEKSSDSYSTTLDLRDSKFDATVQKDNAMASVNDFVDNDNDDDDQGRRQDFISEWV